MPRNVEIKARVETLAGLAAKVAPIADEGPTEILQDDTFFKCDAGRLKLRRFANGTGELIFYRRANEQGPKESFYVRSPTSAPDSLREALALACGAAGRVRKHRTLFLVGRTRVHLDRVEGLAGVREAGRLMDMLGVEPSQLIEGAYVDLLERQSP
jgi:adenylate cyclase class IV